MATRLSEIYAGRSREEVLANAKRMLVEPTGFPAARTPGVLHRGTMPPSGY